MRAEGSIVRRFLLICLCAASAHSAIAEARPFGVDMYVKFTAFDYYLFRGNRGVAYFHMTPGWSIGTMKSGQFALSIADGRNITRYALPSVETSWRPGEWTHVAGSFSDGRLTLWINGEKASERFLTHQLYGKDTNVCCVTSRETDRPVITTCLDPMSAVQYKGGIVDCRVFDRALTDDEVAARAARVRKMRAEDPDAPRKVSDAEGIDVMPPRADALAPLTLQPTPKSVRMSEKSVALGGPVEIVAPDVKLAARAAEVLKKLLRRNCGMDAAIVPSATSAARTVIAFRADPACAHEAYALKGGAQDGAYRVELVSRDGFLYGVDTLRQLVRLRALGNGRRPSLPTDFEVDDAPLVSARASMGFWEDFAGQDEPEGFALRRLNMMWMSRTYRPECTEAKLRACCERAAEYGFGISAGFNYQNLPRKYTFSRPETLDEMKAQIDKLGRAGVRGLTLLFDDLSGDAVKAWADDPEIRRTFCSEGAFHNALAMKALDYAKPYPNLRELPTAICPQWYARSHHGWGEGYYADFTKGFAARGVEMYHCDLATEDVAHLKALGAETYAYYLNGLWEPQRFFTWFVHLPTLRWSWYTWYVDLNGRGPVVLPEAIASFRTIHERTKIFLTATGGTCAERQTGIVSWNPPAYDPDRCDCAMVQDVCGTGTYGPLRTFETALLPILGYLGACRTGFTAECHVQYLPRLVGTSDKELAGYRRNYEAARRALAEFEAAVAAQSSPFDRPVFEDARPLVVKGMTETLEAVGRRLRQELVLTEESKSKGGSRK